MRTNAFITPHFTPHPTAVSSSLNAWFFKGTETTPSTSHSSDAITINIHRTSPNSRRIGGEITVPASIEDVWAILTDYDNLATHVPNLMESRRVNSFQGEQGDGRHQCRLYQRGAQKIIGFEFGADVTMDMKESFEGLYPSERKIEFKCVDSFFFSEFNGEWRVSSDVNGKTKVFYTVDVRPKGPVPVTALEWRIKEDVPNNLKAVKKAAIEVGVNGVMERRMNQATALPREIVSGTRKLSESRTKSMVEAGEEEMREFEEKSGDGLNTIYAVGRKRLSNGRAIDWSDDETLAAYLRNITN